MEAKVQECEIHGCSEPVNWIPIDEGTARLCDGHWKEFDVASDTGDTATAMRLFAEIQKTRRMRQ